MKCVLLVVTDTITRLSDEFAAKLVTRGLAHYIPKAEWKAAGRPTDKAKSLAPVIEIQAPLIEEKKTGWVEGVNYWPLDKSVAATG